MPTQDEVIGLLAQLFRSDLLQTCALPNFSDLQQRQSKEQRNRLLTPLKSPMAIRFPLFDPDRFLNATMPLVEPLLGWLTVVIWLVVVGVASFLAIMHWTDLSNNLSGQLFGLENLVLLSLIYPLLKVVHEFGHAYMVKKWGGEVHEMGIMLLVFMPIPYIDASASLSYRNKYQRMLVGAAGILVEVFIAALALLVWLNVEPGVVRAVAFNVMLIAGISTVLFNGNPLLRFDAYYVLADFLEIPNLGQRSSRYVGYLCQRYLLGVRQAVSPSTVPSEVGWLVVYAVVSFMYRMFIAVQIILFVAGQFFFIGLLLAFWVGVTMLVMPVWRVIKYLFKDGHMQRKRLRITLVVLFPLALLLFGLIFVPAPFYTICEGVIWAPEESKVYAAVDGFVAEILCSSGTTVTKGTALLRCEDVQLATRVRLIEARQREYQARYTLSLQTDRTEAALLKEALARIAAELDRAKERQQSLVIRSHSSGVFVLPQEENLDGRFIRRGTPLGYILDRHKMLVKVLVTQADIDRVRADTGRVQVWLAEDIGRTVAATVVREVPAASHELPSLSFSLDGGGRFALDPRYPDRLQALEQLFQFDIKMAEALTERIGGRVYVRFQHQPEPLAWRWYRNLRRLLLSRFSI
jgi:putative peptide zinc metalloprotease protein